MRAVFEVSDEFGEEVKLILHNTQIFQGVLGANLKLSFRSGDNKCHYGPILHGVDWGQVITSLGLGLLHSCVHWIYGNSWWSFRRHGIYNQNRYTWNYTLLNRHKTPIRSVYNRIKIIRVNKD